jgi:hypothetical protein
VIEKSNLGSPETVIIHVWSDGLRTKRNLDFVMREVCALVATAKRNLPNCRLVLNGVLRRKDVSWRRIGLLNDRYDWVANVLRLIFVDLKSWIEEEDFDRDRLHLIGRGKRQLGQLNARGSRLDVG